MLEIHPIPAFADNYIWALINPQTLQAAIVDPGAAEPVLAYFKAKNLILNAILLTHHHADHIGGVPELLQHFSVPVYGPKSKYISTVTNPVNQETALLLPEQGLQLQIQEIPGHTLDHIAYYNSDLLFCGDTLFTAGCGRIFEGTATQMLAAMQFMASLSESTKIYCGHEYTVKNLEFALTVEPENSAIRKRLANAQELRAKGLPTVPSTMHEELATNPFLRTKIPAVIAAAEKHAKRELATEVEVFAELRSWKNSF